MGEGGAVFTNNPMLKVIAESFRDWGRDCYCAPGCDNTCGDRFGQQYGSLPQGYDHKYVYAHLGYNLKITDMQAACGSGSSSNAPRTSSIRASATSRCSRSACPACPNSSKLPRQPLTATHRGSVSR